MKQPKTKISTKKQADLDKPHPKYRNIIFDLGGVLVQFRPEEIIEKTFKDLPEKPWYLMDVIRSREFAEIDRGIFTVEQAFNELVQQFPHDNFKNIFFTFCDAVIAGLEPLHDGVKILNTVRSRGFKTYILSNLFGLTHKRVAHYEFLKSFDGAIFSYQVKMVKPNPEIYRTLLSTYNLTADECIFIDDLEPNITSALTVGIDGIVCKDHGYVWEELKKRGIVE